MTEAIIITAIIVGGIVALAWVLVRFAFKAWQTERILSHDKESLATEVHINSAATPLSSEQVLSRLGYTPN